MNKIFSRGVVAVAMLGMVACGAPSITRAEAITKLDAIANHAVPESSTFKMSEEMTMSGNIGYISGEATMKYVTRLSIPDSYYYSCQELTQGSTTQKMEQWSYIDGTELYTVQVLGDTKNVNHVPGNSDSWKVANASTITSQLSYSKSAAAAMKEQLTAMDTSAEGITSEKYTSTGDGNVYIEFNGTASGQSAKSTTQFDNYLFVSSTSNGAGTTINLSINYTKVDLTKYSA